VADKPNEQGVDLVMFHVWSACLPLLIDFVSLTDALPALIDQRDFSAGDASVRFLLHIVRLLV
jgi:hypothetical protein